VTEYCSFANRRSLAEDAPKLFDADLNVLVAKVDINVVNQVSSFVTVSFFVKYSVLCFL